ncbi:MAG TPA: NfeD family protein [Longimicrobium sp.]|nr:NfeD family protein [Longimicrobium sp.]
MRLIPMLAAVLSLLSTAAAAQPHGTLVLGVAGWMPLLMLLAGLVLLAVEVFVIPGFGWTGVLGVLAALGAVILAVSPGPADAALTFGIVISSLTLLGIALWHVGSRLRAGHPLLGGMLRRDEGYVASLPRPELEGLDGIALTDLRPAGTAQIGDERLDVVSEAGWISAGSPVRVLRAEGYRHVVRAVPLPPPAREPGGEASGGG